MELRDAFTWAYDEFYWKNPESRSGPGSTLDYTKSLRALLPGVLRGLGVRTMLDAPCGDFHWMKEVDLSGIQYIGGDIVEKMVFELRDRYPAHEFSVVDITKDKLPQVDLWLCRDVLIHLSNHDILKILYNFLRSGSRLLATSHFPYNHLNGDVQSGPRAFHEVNLCHPPFGLAQPLITLPDSIPGYPARWLGIWDRAQVVAWFNVHVLVAQDGSKMLTS